MRAPPPVTVVRWEDDFPFAGGALAFLVREDNADAFLAAAVNLLAVDVIREAGEGDLRGGLVAKAGDAAADAAAAAAAAAAADAAAAEDVLVAAFFDIGARRALMGGDSGFASSCTTMGVAADCMTWSLLLVVTSGSCFGLSGMIGLSGRSSEILVLLSADSADSVASHRSASAAFAGPQDIRDVEVSSGVVPPPSPFPSNAVGKNWAPLPRPGDCDLAVCREMRV